MGVLEEGIWVLPGREGPAGHPWVQKDFRQDKAVTIAFRENEMRVESGGRCAYLGKQCHSLKFPIPV